MVRVGRVVVVATLLLATGVARGQELDPARAHYEAGAAYYRSGQWASAAHEFEQAFRISPRPRLLYNLALCAEKLGRLEEVAAHLRHFIGLAHRAAERDEARAWLTRVEAQLAAQPRPRPQSPPRPAPASAAAAPASAPSHVEPSPGPSITTPPPRPGRPPWRTWTAVGVSVTAVAALSLGAAYGLVARSKNADSLDHCRTATLCSPTGVTLRQDAFTAARISTATFAVGGVLAAGALGLWLWPSGRGHARERPAGVALAPYFGSAGGGLAVRGRF